MRPGHPAATRALRHALLKPLSVMPFPAFSPFVKQKTVANDRPVLPLQSFGDPLLIFENPPQLGREGKHPALAVLSRARVTTDLANLHVDLAPFERENFAGSPAARNVRKLHDTDTRSSLRGYRSRARKDRGGPRR